MSASTAKRSEFLSWKVFLFSHIINILLTELSRSVWENLDLGHEYRPHCVRSVLTTSDRILPYRPPAPLIRAKLGHFTILGQKNAQNMTRYYTVEKGKNTDEKRSNKMVGHCRTGQKYGRKAEQQNGRTKRPKLWLNNGGIINPLFDGLTY